jgi:hypothetical protein
VKKIALRIGLVVILGAVAALAHYASRRGTPEAAGVERMAPAVGMPGAPSTSADGLKQRIAEAERVLKERPDDVGASLCCPTRSCVRRA